jgi:hypothetical protein
LNHLYQTNGMKLWMMSVTPSSQSTNFNNSMTAHSILQLKQERCI